MLTSRPFDRKLIMAKQTKLPSAAETEPQEKEKPKRANLTERYVKALKAPESGHTIVWDNDLKGFGVRISAVGSVAFLFNYRTRAGRQRRLTIGSWPTFSVEAAREEA